MGCVSSRRDINDLYPNIFQVMNVDDHGQLVSPGQLELTETEMILYSCNGRAATRWPLRCLRRYGFDAEIFSFESGRRCPTGPGIFAFRCNRAEQLFNLLQQLIQRSRNEEISVSTNEYPVPSVTPGPPVPERPIVQTIERVFPHRNSNSGPLSPPAISPPSINSSDTLLEHNNNNHTNLPLYTNVSQPTLTPAAVVSSPSHSATSENYTAMSTESDVDGNNAHLYINVSPGEVIPVQPTVNATTPLPDVAAEIVTDTEVYGANDVPMTPKLITEGEEEDPKHFYANLDTEEIEKYRSKFIPTTEPVAIVPQTPPGKEVNYATLDLNKTKDTQLPNISSGPLLVPPDSPRELVEGYTVIDLNKTVALSQSSKPRIELDNEGSRKTRHNSTISDFGPAATRHSSSLSD